MINNPYPYYIYPEVLALRQGTADEKERKAYIRKIAANIGDEETIRIIAGIDPEEFSSFYPDMEPVSPSTEETIDSFISNFGKEVQPPVPQTEKTAKEMIARGDYRGALEIIKALNLNNPEKNIYFADQIRFLKKLIFIEELENRQGLTNDKNQHDNNK